MTRHSPAVQAEIDRFLQGLHRRNPHEPEFHQAVREVVDTILPWVLEHPEYRKAQILERMTEPDRVVIFRVTWEDDQGNFRANRAWRVQFNNAIGPYKGGLRFHRTVTLSVLKFLGFEQTFKNSLTGLPMGGAKGGSNFNPRGKSDREVMRFCQAMMTELHRHIGAEVDVPAGDIGVGARELGFLFGQWKRVRNQFSGAITGKGLPFGGSLVRKQATGYGAVYFTELVLHHHGEALARKRVAVSGSGNVAIYAIEKLLHKGATVVSASDSSGTVHLPGGFDREKLAALKEIKEVRRGRIRELADAFDDVAYLEGKRPWGIPVDVAMPCATQNELDAEDAGRLIDNGVRMVTEGANMPCTAEAVERFRDAGVLFAPGKAANAGGVAVSGLEQAQNAQRISWTAERVDQTLQEIMAHIHGTCVTHGGNGPIVDYVRGANLGGFIKVADAMLAYGAV